MKVVRIFETFYGVDGTGQSHALFTKGGIYPLTEATQRQADLMNGEVVDAPDDYVKAQAAADAAQASADKAADKAATAADAAALAAAAVLDAVPADAAPTA